MPTYDPTHPDIIGTPAWAEQKEAFCGHGKRVVGPSSFDLAGLKSFTCVIRDDPRGSVLVSDQITLRCEFLEEVDLRVDWNGERV